MNKIILLLALCLTLAFISSSDAQRGIGGGFGKLGVRDKAKGSGGGGTCTNRLDFSASCNSQYIVTGPLR